MFVVSVFRAWPHLSFSTEYVICKPDGSCGQCFSENTKLTLIIFVEFW